MVASINQSPVLVPLIDRLEEILLAQAHQYVVVIEFYFWGDRADIHKQRIKIRNDVVAFPFFELPGKVAVPKISPYPEIQFIGEEKIKGTTTIVF